MIFLMTTCLPPAYTALVTFRSGKLVSSKLIHQLKKVNARKISKFSRPKKLCSFTSFTSLPKELQLVVWKFAVQNLAPRTVKLELHLPYGNTPTFAEVNIIGTHLTARLICKSQVPFLLHICRDSRELALQRYKLAFQVLLQDRPVYFDIDQDTLWVVGGRAHCQMFPVVILAMNGYRNLIITPSPDIFDLRFSGSAPIQLAKHLKWRKQFFANGGGEKRIQIVRDKTRSIFDDYRNTKSFLLHGALNMALSGYQIGVRRLDSPSIKVVWEHKLKFGGC